MSTDEYTTLGREMIQELRDFCDALESGEPLEKRFKIHEVMRCPACDQIMVARFDSTGIARCFSCGGIVQRLVWWRGPDRVP